MKIRCVALAFASLALGLALQNAPAREARPLDGACYSPFRPGQAPGGTYPTAAELQADLSPGK